MNAHDPSTQCRADSQADVVYGVVVEVLLGAPVALGRARVRVAGRHLDLVQRRPRVQGQRDERVPGRVGRDVLRDTRLRARRTTTFQTAASESGR